MKKGDKSSSSSGIGKGKPAVEKGKRASIIPGSRWTSIHKPPGSNQEEVDKYLAKYGFLLNPEIKVEFCLHDVDVSQALPNGGVYMHPRVLALRLKLPMMRFVHSVLTFYRAAPSPLSVVA